MQIQFTPRAADAGVIVLPVEKEGLGRIAFGDFADSDQKTVLGAARANRFEGEAGAIVDSFVADRRVLLLGLGAGSEEDYERAGGALVARLLADP